ncbi:MAG: methyltransferase [Clostridiales bacterium]|nr:methyltransferase [Clostridiales bacterium]
MDVFDREEETLEDLGRSGLKLIQRKDGFRFGEDTVLLSWFVAENLRFRKKDPMRVLELGTNCGAASVLLAGRRKDVRIDGVERQKEAQAVFERNIKLNSLSDRVRGFCLDLRDLPSEDVKYNSYDAVFMNPPFRSLSSGPVTSEEIHSQALKEARFAVHGDVGDFLSCAAKMLSSQGDIFLVDRAETFSSVMDHCLRLSLVPKRITFVHPYIDREATLFLLMCKKGGKKAGTVITPPLILRGQDREYTPELRKIYFEEE